MGEPLMGCYPLKRKLEIWKAVHEEMNLVRIAPGCSRGICFYIMRVNGYDWMPEHNNLKKNWPEMWKHRPQKLYRETWYWWQPRTSRALERRIGVVEKIIEELEILTTNTDPI